MKTKINNLILRQQELTRKENLLKSEVFDMVAEALKNGEIILPNSDACAHRDKLSEEEKHHMSILLNGIRITYKDENDNEIHYALLGKLFRDPDTKRIMMSGLEAQGNNTVSIVAPVDTILDPDKLLIFLLESYNDPEEPELNKANCRK